MPIFRYFVIVGSLLLVLLFAANLYLPTPDGGTSAPAVDKTAIRIRSARILPEKIVLDISVVPPSTAAVMADASAAIADPIVGEQKKADASPPATPTGSAEPPVFFGTW